jgi:hypothetical protein
VIHAEHEIDVYEYQVIPGSHVQHFASPATVMENVEHLIEKTVLFTYKKQSIDKNDSGNRTILRETGTPFTYTLYYEIQYIKQQGKPAQKI